MRFEMNLTIRDYFNRQISTGRQPKRGSPVKSCPHAGESAFSGILAASQDRSSSQGLSIQDYFRKRIRSHSPDSSAEPVSVPTPCTPPHPKASPTQAVPLVPAGADLSVKPMEIKADHQKLPPGDDRREILNCIHQAAARFNLPPALINAVIKAESDYQVRAVSPAGAQGLMQLMPATARELGVMDPFDIGQNIDGGARYLRKMLDQFDGDIRMALSAYNAGPGTVARFRGQVPYAETRNYVQRVLRYAGRFSETEST